MQTLTAFYHLFPAGARVVARQAKSWWHLLQFGAIALVVALTPSTYDGPNRLTLARLVYASTWPVLPWFTALSALLSLVLIRVVLVTAQSYGLSQYALEMVVRVLVLELIPLSAALFVTLRAGMVFNAVSLAQYPKHPVATLVRQNFDPLRSQWVPEILATTFTVLALATLSSMIALVQAYLTVYGLSPWGLPDYTRTVGRVFDLSVTLGFMLKTLFFSLAVALVPMAASLEASHKPTSLETVQPGAARLFLVLLLIEAASLAVKYI